MEETGLLDLGLPEEWRKAFRPAVPVLSVKGYQAFPLVMARLHAIKAKNHIIRCREKVKQTEDLAKPPKTSILDILKVTTVIQDMTVYTRRLITQEARLFLEVDITTIEC